MWARAAADLEHASYWYEKLDSVFRRGAPTSTYRSHVLDQLPLLHGAKISLVRWNVTVQAWMVLVLVVEVAGLAVAATLELALAAVLKWVAAVAATKPTAAALEIEFTTKAGSC